MKCCTKSTSVSTSSMRSPARGSSRQPRISTGVPGGASLKGWPLWSKRPRTLAWAKPLSSTEPLRRVPRETMAVDSLPRRGSVFDSTTIPSTRPVGSALSPIRVACVLTASARSSRLVPLRAEIGITCTSPPCSSRASPICASSRLLFSWNEWGNRRAF